MQNIMVGLMQFMNWGKIIIAVCVQFHDCPVDLGLLEWNTVHYEKAHRLEMAG